MSYIKKEIYTSNDVNIKTCSKKHSQFLSRLVFDSSKNIIINMINACKIKSMINR